jgi:tripartite-type tricarboxylate transporter receptor subunit TctC
MAGELFKAMAGVDIVHVPYKGKRRRAHRDPRRPGADDDRRDHHDGAEWRAGKLKALGTTGSTRSSVLPDVPPSLKPAFPATRRNLARVDGAAGTPRPILERLNAEINKILNSQDVRENWTKQGRDADGMSNRPFRQVPARGNRQVGQTS